MQGTTLKVALLDFQQKVNTNQRLKPILRAWEPDIVLEATDSEPPITLRVRSTEIVEIIDGPSDGEHRITVRGTTDVLRAIFEGTTNPAVALLEGDIDVLGSDKDQVKLDAISLVIWGL